MLLERLKASMEEDPHSYVPAMQLNAAQILGDTTASPSTVERYVREELPMGHEKSLGHTAWAMTRAVTMLASGQSSKARLIVLFALASIEQGKLDNNWTAAWRLTMQTQPPFSEWRAKEAVISQLRTDFVHARLIHPTWAAGVIARLRDEEVLTRRRQKPDNRPPKGKGRGQGQEANSQSTARKDGGRCLSSCIDFWVLRAPTLQISCAALPCGDLRAIKSPPSFCLVLCHSPLIAHLLQRVPGANEFVFVSDGPLRCLSTCRFVPLILSFWGASLLSTTRLQGVLSVEQDKWVKGLWRRARSLCRLVGDLAGCGSKINAVQFSLDSLEAGFDSLSDLVYGAIKQGSKSSTEGPGSSQVVPTVASKVAFPEVLADFDPSPFLPEPYLTAFTSPNCILRDLPPPQSMLPMTSPRTELWRLMHRWGAVNRFTLALECEAPILVPNNLFCLEKPDGELRQTIDRRPRNALEKGPPKEAPKMGHCSVFLGLIIPPNGCLGVP